MEKFKRIHHWLIAFTILVQPLIDILRRVGCANYEVFGLSIIELVNILLVGTIFVMTVISYDNKKKLLKWLALLVPYIIYFGFHYYNITQFNTLVYPQQTTSIVIEFYYLFKLFIIPLVLIFSIYYSGIKKEDLFQIFELFILIVAGTICFLNICGLSFYSYDNGSFSNFTILEWFTYNGGNFHELTSKGWFDSGNQISAIMFITLPVTLYLAYSKQKKYNYLILCIQLLAMLMLGTKIANIGCILILMAFFGVTFFKKYILKKETKKIKWIFLITIITFILFVFSPRGYELLNKDEISSNIGGSNETIPSIDLGKNEKLNCLNLTINDKKYLEKFILENQYALKLPEYILKSYPPDYNHTFWCYVSKVGLDRNSRAIDYREIKTDILKQIYIKNNNEMDKWVGMGYTLNYIYTEEDYTYQYYTYGIFGILLFIGPYFVILAYVLFNFLRNFKQAFTIENVLIILSLMIALVIPYLSGHVLERAFPLYVIAFICVLNLLLVKHYKK